MENVVTLNGKNYSIEPLHDLMIVSEEDIESVIPSKIGNIILSKPIYFNKRIYNLGKIQHRGHGKCRINVKENDLVYYGHLGTYDVELPDTNGKFQKYTFIKDVNILGTLR